MWGWFEVANWLRIPVGECMERMTHREFELTLEYLSRKQKERTPEQLLLMRIAQLVAGGDKPIEAFAVKWEPAHVPTKSKDGRTRESIGAWRMATGIDSLKHRKRKPKQ